MMLQTFVVALLVAGCTGYAAWTLMPSAWRRPIARGLLKLPGWPEAVAVRLAAASRGKGAGCGCDGCDHAVKNRKSVAVGVAGQASIPASAAAQPVTFYPTVRR